MVILSSEYSEGVGDYEWRKQYYEYILYLTHTQYTPNFSVTSSYRSPEFGQTEVF